MGRVQSGRCDSILRIWPRDISAFFLGHLLPGFNRHWRLGFQQIRAHIDELSIEGVKWNGHFPDRVILILGFHFLVESDGYQVTWHDFQLLLSSLKNCLGQFPFELLLNKTLLALGQLLANVLAVAAAFHGREAQDGTAVEARFQVLRAEICAALVTGTDGSLFTLETAVTGSGMTLGRFVSASHRVRLSEGNFLTLCLSAGFSRLHGFE